MRKNVLILSLLVVIGVYANEYTVGPIVPVVSQVLKVSLSPSDCDRDGECRIVVTIPYNGKITRSRNAGTTFQTHATNIYADLSKMKTRETLSGTVVVELPLIVGVSGGLGIFMASGAIEKDMKKNLNGTLELEYIGPEIKK